MKLQINFLIGWTRDHQHFKKRSFHEERFHQLTAAVDDFENLESLHVEGALQFKLTIVSENELASGVESRIRTGSTHTQSIQAHSLDPARRLKRDLVTGTIETLQVAAHCEFERPLQSNMQKSQCLTCEKEMQLLPQVQVPLNEEFPQVGVGVKYFAFGEMGFDLDAFHL